MDILLFCLVGGMVSADTDAAWQSMLSQPLVACSLAGVCLGNFALGCTVGVLFQLPYLVEIPVGGSKVSMSNLAAFVAAGVAIELSEGFAELTNVFLFVAVFYGILLSGATTFLLGWSRRLNLFLVRTSDRAINEGNLSRITLLNFLGVLNAVMFGIFFSAIFFFFGKYMLFSLVGRFPIQIENFLMFFKPTLLGAGVGTMIWFFLRKKTLGVMLAGGLVSAAVLLFF